MTHEARAARRLVLAAVAVAGALAGIISVQHVALTAVAATAVDHSLASCSAISAVLTPAVIGAIAGALVAVIGAVGSVLVALRKPPGPGPNPGPGRG